MARLVANQLTPHARPERVHRQPRRRRQHARLRGSRARHAGRLHAALFERVAASSSRRCCRRTPATIRSRATTRSRSWRRRSNILVVHPSVPAKSVQELVAYAKANPGKINFSSGGIGTLPHLIGEYFKAKAGIEVVHVPYRGGGPSIQDVVAGNIQYTFEGISVLHAADRGRPAARARGHEPEAQPADARIADHDRKRLPRISSRRAGPASWRRTACRATSSPSSMPRSTPRSRPPR